MTLVVYYQIALGELLPDHEESVLEVVELCDYICRYYLNSSAGTFDPKCLAGTKYLLEALDDLCAKKIIFLIPDEFVGPTYAVPEGAARKLSKYYQSIPKHRDFKGLGGVGRRWLEKALLKIETESGNASARTVNVGDSTSPNDQDRTERWEPIALDKEASDYASAVKGIERAIRSVAADNGFGVEYPAERDNLVSQANVTLEMVKQGKVTQPQIRSSFVSAGRWLVEKFSGTALGTLGAELVKWGLKLLGLMT